MVAENNGLPSYNPNFPLHLDIHPSTIPTAQIATLADARLDAQFGSAAQEAAIVQYGIAGRVWEASYAIILYMQPPNDIEFDPPFIEAERKGTSTEYSMLELGSGTGLVASSLLKLLDPRRDHLIVTDLPEVCPLLEANIYPVSTRTDSPLNSLVTIMPLSWGNYDDVLNFPKLTCLTHIICSDLVYFPDLLGPLLRSLLQLSSPPFGHPSRDAAGDDQSNPTVIISYKLRSLVKETAFWSAFGLWFAFVPVLARDKCGEKEWTRFGEFDDSTFIFVAHRRPESFDWKIPPLDEQLLAGVGAHGTDDPKGDDTFELLLFMGLDH